VTGVWDTKDRWWSGLLFFGLLVAYMIATPVVLHAVLEIPHFFAWTWGVVLSFFVDAILVVTLLLVVSVARATYRWLKW
jgi:hypothetical protein